MFPFLVGVVGYGSINLPYAGTGLAAASSFVTLMLLATLCSLPSCNEQEFAGTTRRALACSALASFLIVIPFGLTIAGIISTELPLPVIRRMLYSLSPSGPAEMLMALGLFAAGSSAVLGAFGGLVVGCATRLATLLRRVSTPTRRR